eukprot:4708548-Pleurochrysis_carterae.AAC.2
MLQPQRSAKRPVTAHGTGQGISLCPESVPARAATSLMSVITITTDHIIMSRGAAAKIPSRGQLRMPGG